MIQIQLWQLCLVAGVNLAALSVMVFYNAKREFKVKKSSFEFGRLIGRWTASKEIIDQLITSIESGCDVHEIRDCLKRGEIPQRTFTQCDRVKSH
jgi:hypothetical protein